MFGTVVLARTIDESSWHHYGGSERGTQYSSLRQIDRHNVQQLILAWQFRTGELGQGAADGYSFQANPIVAGGRLYLTTGSGIIIALNPRSGRELWRFDPQLDRSRHTAETANRGVSSWFDSKRDAKASCYQRIFSGTLDGRLIAVDGRTGQVCQDFGNDGEVDLSVAARPASTGNRTQTETDFEYAVTSPPVIVDDVLVVGSSIGDNRAVDVERGIVRGLDARTGRQLWSFDPVPRDASDPVYQTWRKEQARLTGAANAWAPLAADTRLGLVYVPTGSASPDFYGGQRLGDNRYANSLVALEASTGRVRWHQQLVHHDVWDYDLPAQPTLVNLQREGKTVPAVIQATKTGLLFTFNRLTGEPIFPIEERPVPQQGVAGEQLSPTQPFPLAPPPLMTHEPVTQAWGLTWLDKWSCQKQITALRSEGIFTPPSLEGSLMLPAYTGGINWGGVAFSTAQQIAVVRVTELPAVVQLIERQHFHRELANQASSQVEIAAQAGTPYAMKRQVLTSWLGLPCTAPPWGWVKAVDMKEGKILWQIPHGTVEDLAPAWVPNLPWGVPGLGGPIITAGQLVFIAAAMDNYLRALDLQTGKELWRARLPAGGQATPMTYEVDGHQFVVIAAGGHQGAGTSLGDYLLAFSLPVE